MADRLILERLYGGGDFVVNPKDYNHDPARFKEALKDFAELKKTIKAGIYDRSEIKKPNQK